MTSTPDSEIKSEQGINYVPINNYLLPPAPISHHARERLASLRKLFKRIEPEQEPLKSKESLSAVPSCLLDRLASLPEWAEFADALHLQLADWLTEDSTAQPVILIVGPPDSGNTEILELLAERQAWKILNRPSSDQILNGGDNWLAELDDTDGSPWVLPALEDIYLRHTEGLGLFRNFIDSVTSGKMGKGVIGCDSWAWAYLRPLWRGPAPLTLSLQAFDEHKLTNHLQQKAHDSCTRQLIFRQADNGKYVLPYQDIDATSGAGSDFVRILAAHSRGIIGVALTIWRTCLLAEPDEALEEKDMPEGPNAPQQTLWVIPWSQVEPPSLPTDSGRNAAFILHALLLHNGLPLELLTLLLPLGSSQTIETLYQLKEKKIVTQVNYSWRISPQGYPAVRQFLQSNNYLVDQF